MCWQCDHPDATYRDVREQIRQSIARFGWTIQAVERDGVHPPWAYTVGLTAIRRPELVITGMPLTTAVPVLHGVAAHFAHAGIAPGPGEQAELADGPVIEIVTVTAPWAHLNVAVDFYGEKITALQLVHADDRGQWPWDRGYRAGRGGQPVLGIREPPERRKRAG